MKQASMPDEACFMCQRSLFHWATKPVSLGNEARFIMG